MPKRNDMLAILEDSISEFGSCDKVAVPKLDMDVCMSISQNLGGSPAGTSLYQAVHHIYGANYVIQADAVALLLEAVKHIAVAITEISKNSNEQRKKFCREKVAYVSTAHITETDSENLAEMSWKDRDIATSVSSLISRNLHVIAMDSGYFIYLGGVSMDYVHEELSDMSPDFKRLLASAINCKFDWLHLDADGDIVEGLPTHNW